MQSADHVHFSHSEVKGVSYNPDNFLNRVLKGVRIAFLGGKSTELARQHTDIGVIDVPVVDVRGVVAVLALAHHVRDHSKAVEIIRAIERQSVRL